MLILLIFYAIFGQRCIGVTFIVLASGSLQQNVIDAAINKWRKRLASRVCVQMDNILETFYELLIRAKNHGQKSVLKFLFLKKLFLCQ